MKKQNEKLTIEIGADVAKCLRGLDLVQKRLDKIEASINRISKIKVDVSGTISGKDLLMYAGRANEKRERLA